MSQNGIFPMNQRDLIRQFQALLHVTQRDDVKVQIQFLVNFSVDEETYVNTVMDPWQPLPRTRLRELVAAVLTKLDQVEAENIAERKAQAVLIGASNAVPGIPETNAESQPEDVQDAEIVAEYNQSPGG